MWYVVFFFLQLIAAVFNVYFFFHMHEFIWLKISVGAFAPSIVVLVFAVLKGTGGGQFNCFSIMFMLLNIAEYFFFTFLYVASKYMIGS